MRSKLKTKENFLKQKFEEFIAWGFVYIEGEWTPAIRKEIENHLKTFNKKITMSRIIKGPAEINETHI